jgi:hypothetical protein
VNAGQATKLIMQELTVPAVLPGSGDGMQTQGTGRNTGSPRGDRGRDQLAARESQAGP